MRINDMNSQDESYWYFNKLSPLLLLKTYRDSKWEWIVGFKGLKTLFVFFEFTLNIVIPSLNFNKSP